MSRLCLLAALAVLLAGAGTATALEIEWTTTFGGDDADFAYDVVETADGGVVSAGIGSDGNYQSFLVVKTDASGNPLWTREVNLSDRDERAFSVLEISGGDLLVVGAALLEGQIHFRPFLARLTAVGEVIWTTEDGLSQDLPTKSGIVRAIELADGNLALAGGSNTMTNPQDPWTAIVSADGELLSYNEYEPLLSGFGEGTYFESILALAEGGFAISGTAAPGLGQAFLWVFDDNGEPLWSQLYGADFFRLANDVARTADGGFVLTGCDLPNCTDTVVMRTDAAGERQWTVELPVGDRAEGRSVISMGNDCFLVAQRIEVGYVAYETRLLEIGGNGELLDSMTVPAGSVSTWVEKLRTVDGGAGFIGTGNVRDVPNVSSLDVLVLRGDYPDGNVTTSVEPSAAPAGATLLRIRPNPTSRTFAIDAPQERLSRVEVFDVHGRLLREVVPAAGWAATITVELDGLASGVYFVRTHLGDRVETARIALRR